MDKPTTTAAKSTKTKAKTKSKSNITIPKHSEIILDYTKNGNIGFCKAHESYDISGSTEKILREKISALFHFLRNTPVTKDIDTHKTAMLTIDKKPILSLSQKAGDYKNQVFSITVFKDDGTKQSTRKYKYNAARNIILKSFGFDVKVDEDEDEAENGGIEDDTGTITPNDSGNFEDETGFDDMD